MSGAITGWVPRSWARSEHPDWAVDDAPVSG